MFFCTIILLYLVLTCQCLCSKWCGRHSTTWMIKCNWKNCNTCGDCINRPNILVILADDVGVGDISGYHASSMVDTVHINTRMINKGVKFTDFHSMQLCAPSRYAILSGRYTHRGTAEDGTWSIRGSSQFRDDQESLASVLAQNGYRTAMFGKWHLGGKAPTVAGKNMDKTRNKLIRSTNHDWSKKMIYGPSWLGFDTSYMTVAGIQSSPYTWFRDSRLNISVSDVQLVKTGRTHWSPFGSWSFQEVQESTAEIDPEFDITSYNQVLVNETASFIDSVAGKPFFAHVCLGSVHIPHYPPNYFGDTRVKGTHATHHLDLLFEMDLVVGTLLDILESRKMMENTIVVFVSDNGGIRLSQHVGHQSNGPLRGNKGSSFQGGHRVPMIMRWDGHIPPNEDRSHLVSITDIYSTICDLVDVKVNPGQAPDSVSFAKYVVDRDDTERLRDSMLLAKKGDQVWRQGNYSYVNSVYGVQYLYDLSNDPYETTNLIHVPDLQETVATMQLNWRRVYRNADSWVKPL